MSGTLEAPSTADVALLRAFRAWGTADLTRALGRFEPSWRDRLASAWPSVRKTSPALAFGELRHDHEASARLDPNRVHPSWFVRALEGESAAVRSVVTAQSPAMLGLGEPERTPDLSPDPDALRWALALWAERLVGDVANRSDDPPVIVALTRLRFRALARLITCCGQVKHAFAIEKNGPSDADEGLVRMRTLDRVRLAFFRRIIGQADPRLIEAARADLTAIGAIVGGDTPLLGLLTFGRLLGSAEPHRARWALQHQPYAVARRMKPSKAKGLSTQAAAGWESWVLDAGWARLLAEGRLSAEFS